MASTHECNGISASPNSSEEIESHRGTPATKLSAFSPEDNFEHFKAGGHGIIRANVPPAFNLVHTNTNFSPNSRFGKTTSLLCQDPFISIPTSNNVTQPSTGVTKLSPAASNFTPASSIGFTPSSKNTTTRKCIVPGPPSLEFLSTNIQATTFQHVCPTARGITDNDFSPEGGLSRAMTISQISPTTSVDVIYGLFRTFHSLEHILVAELPSTGAVYLKFGDLRDVEVASSAAKAYCPIWTVRCMSPKDFLLKLQPESLKHSSVSLYEGQVLVKAEYDVSLEPVDVGAITGHVKQFLGNFGELMALRTVMKDDVVSTYRAEFFNVSAVKKALNVNGFKISGCTLSISPYKPDVESTLQHPGKVPGPLIIGQDSSLESALGSMSISNRHNAYGSQTPRTPAFSSFPNSTPNSRHLSNRNEFNGQHTPSSLTSHTHGFPGGLPNQSSTWSPTYMPCPNLRLHSPTWAPFNPGAIGQERGALTLPPYRQRLQAQRHSGQSKLGGHQHHDYSSNHHNVVDVGKIRNGSDVRTTIMLRNIPNKIDQVMLKTIVDETSFAKYDFMYLRIDFANNCNVGYAFINFEDPYSIIDFVEARAGRRWNRYNSDKVAEVSYATIQGRDCLIQKFRNSSVMLEYPGFRPKLFYAGTGSQAGTEEEFPPPDNPSKMKRSVENAEHVGLFAPRAGQNFRDEQRRRRSQYDRGTRLAEVEDSYDLSHYSNQNETNPFYTPALPGRLRESYPPSLIGPPY